MVHAPITTGPLQKSFLHPWCVSHIGNTLLLKMLILYLNTPYSHVHGCESYTVLLSPSSDRERVVDVQYFLKHTQHLFVEFALQMNSFL